MNTTPDKPATTQPKPTKVLAVKEDDNGKFEVALRLLGNELVALSIAANPFNKRWIILSLITIGFLIFSISIFGDSLVSFSTGVYNIVNAQ